MKVLMYSSSNCPFCEKAKKLLNDKNIKFELIGVDNDDASRAVMEERSQRRTVPQIFINDIHIGGYTDLYAFDQSGQLDQMIADSK